MKKAMANKKITKTDKPAYTLLLKFDEKEVKQLEIAHKITGEKTATKAIIKCLYSAEYYMKQYKELTERVHELQLHLSANKNAIQSFLTSFNDLKELSNTKQNTLGNKKGKKNIQLSIEG